jgi:hypothetical protein
MNRKSTLLLWLFAIGISNALAQNAMDYAIQVKASVQKTPPNITLQWESIDGESVSIYRKSKTASSWSLLSSTTDTFYSDNNVVVDSAYEYKLNASGSNPKSAYLYVAIEMPAPHHRGAMLLLIDDYYVDSCSDELKNLELDIVKDGWDVVTYYLSRSQSDTSIKQIILNEYSRRNNLKGVFIVGHLAVPYSGNIAPDAHPDHNGAWPSDVYYADVNENWTDININTSSATRTQNQNIPGDGKWDLNNINNAELQVSRIDFYDMPAFSSSENEMMKNYLNKAHLFKTNQLPLSYKAVVDDNFGGFGGEAFAANAWRNFPQIIGQENILEADYITTLKDSSYIWSYACGAGSYQSCGGVGTTSDIAGVPHKGIFTMLFGSYFGDWDNTNNFLRAPLCASEPALTTCWAGRPNWYIHHMGLGENIGYSLQITQNNNTLYSPSNYQPKGVHIALMGDLSLRMKYLKPASNLSIAANDSSGAQLSWLPSNEPKIAGYYVYRSEKLTEGYQLISPFITSTSFIDTVGTDGKYYFMVRPVKLEQTHSGQYFNLGLGVIDSANIDYPTNIPLAINFELVALYPNPVANTLHIQGHYKGTYHTIVYNITDMSGKTMHHHMSTCINGTIDEHINVSQLPPGNYILNIVDTQNTDLKAMKFTKK